MSRTLSAKVVGYQGPRYGPRSLNRWSISYGEPGGSVIQLDGVKAHGTRWPDTIDCDREASVGDEAVCIMTDEGRLTFWVDPVPYLGPCPGDTDGGGGGGGGGGVIPPVPGVPIPPGINETPVIPPPGGGGTSPSFPDSGGGASS